MKSAIQSIVPHAFGDHTGCRETLCRYKKDPSHWWVGSKNPKICINGRTESNDYQMSCGVSQVNLGYRYIPRILASLKGP